MELKKKSKFHSFISFIFVNIEYSILLRLYNFPTFLFHFVNVNEITSLKYAHEIVITKKNKSKLAYYLFISSCDEKNIIIIS